MIHTCKKPTIFNFISYSESNHITSLKFSNCTFKIKWFKPRVIVLDMFWLIFCERWMYDFIQNAIWIQKRLLLQEYIASDDYKTLYVSWICLHHESHTLGIVRILYKVKCFRRKNRIDISVYLIDSCFYQGQPMHLIQKIKLLRLFGKSFLLNDF